MRRTTPLALTLLAALAQGCTSCDQVPEGAVTDCELTQVVPGTVMTDILFVIDDSGSMGEEQANLAGNLAAFVNELKLAGVVNDFHIGVTTTSVAGMTGTLTGEQGQLVGNVPAGTPAVLSGDRPDIATELSDRVLSLGTGGSSKEQAFRAMELALSEPLLSGANAGLLRPGARLAVVFLSDEDDCSDFDTPGATSDAQCHNDVTPFVDYKFTRIQTIAHYETFLKGLGRDVVLGAIVGVDPDTKAPSCGSGASLNPSDWCCGGANLGPCTNGIWQDNDGTYCAGGGVTLPDTTVCGTDQCCSGCPTASDRGDRYQALLAKFPASRRLIASVCDGSFNQTLVQIAGLIVTQTVPLEGAPSDWRALVVGVRKAAGGRVNCVTALDGTTAATDAATGVVYIPPGGGLPAKLTFQNGCILEQGDTFQIDLICAG